jgi:hypothetical protein
MQRREESSHSGHREDQPLHRGAWWEAPRGKHHEIYLSDLRRTKPERLKSVIRQPFAQQYRPFCPMLVPR